jgi:hypothetical protein
VVLDYRFDHELCSLEVRGIRGRLDARGVGAVDPAAGLDDGGHRGVGRVLAAGEQPDGFTAYGSERGQARGDRATSGDGQLEVRVLLHEAVVSIP